MQSAIRPETSSHEHRKQEGASTGGKLGRMSTLLFSHGCCAQNEPKQESEPRERQEAAGIPWNVLQDAGSSATDHDLPPELRYFLNVTLYFYHLNSPW